MFLHIKRAPFNVRIWNPLLFETQNNKITINELLLEKRLKQNKIPSSSYRLAIEYKKIIFTPDSKFATILKIKWFDS